MRMTIQARIEDAFQVKRVRLDSAEIVGFKGMGLQDEHLLFEQLQARKHEIAHQISDEEYLVISPKGLVVGVRVSQVVELPEKMVHITIPADDYMIFRFEEKMIGDFWEYFSKTNNRAKYKLDCDKMRFEIFKEELQPKGMTEIYVPVVDEPVLHAPEVPVLSYDGGVIAVTMANHDEAVDWFTKHMGWNLEHQFDNKPKDQDDRIIRERKTILGFGTSVQSLELREGTDSRRQGITAETNIRWCWRTKDLEAARAYLISEGVKTGDIYRGPGNNDYFDFWATSDNIQLTAQRDVSVPDDMPRFVPSWTRIGVSNLHEAQSWYEKFVGMKLLEDRSEQGYMVMGLALEHHPTQYSLWILEHNSDIRTVELLDGAARPVCVLHNKQQFADYHNYLQDQQITVSEILGYPPVKGFSWFHFYDIDGNRFNVIKY